MTYDEIKRRHADGYHMARMPGQAIEDVAWLMHAYRGACNALDGRDRVEREADTLRAALAEVLGWMVHADHPAKDRLQSGWVPVARVEELRRLAGVKP